MGKLDRVRLAQVQCAARDMMRPAGSDLSERGTRGIVTACDAAYFEGLIMMHESVQQSAPVPVAAFDLGLTADQLALARDRPHLTVLPLPGDPRIELIREATRNDVPARKRGKRSWPLWICPILIQWAPFDDVYWLDCDLLVLRSLDRMFEALGTGPVFTPENKAPSRTANDPRLYEHARIERPFDPARPVINAGVSGWRKSRDRETLQAYADMAEHAARDPVVRGLVSWHDQGCLIWAIQKTGMEDRVVDTFHWNLCVDHTALNASPVAFGPGFLDTVRRLVPEAAVVHWNGRDPPWAGARPWSRVAS